MRVGKTLVTWRNRRDRPAYRQYLTAAYAKYLSKANLRLDRSPKPKSSKPLVSHRLFSSSPL